MGDSGKTASLSFKEKNLKRSDYLEWDEYFMAMALLEIRRGPKNLTDNAVIVLNSRKIIISVAHNGVPEEGVNIVDNTYIYHAESKALQKVQGGHVMYTTSFPCDKCAEVIVQAGITEVVYLRNSSNEKAMDVLKQHGVIYRQFCSKKEKVEIDFGQFYDDLPLTPP